VRRRRRRETTVVLFFNFFVEISDHFATTGSRQA
jgi:hypothetical protein